MDEKLTIWEPRKSERAETQRPVRSHSDSRKFLLQNPEVAIRLILLLCAIVVFSSCMVVKRKTEVRLREEFRQQLSAERIRTEQEVLARVKEEYGINAANAEKATMESEAKTVAKVLYAMRSNREDGLHLACWAIFNRVDNLRYADNVYDVSAADQAFMGWADSNPVLDDLYQIALEEVQRWHTGIRPMDSALVYLYWTPSEIYLIDDAGHKFYESDWRNYMDGIGG